MYEPEEIDALIVHVLANQDPGFGLTSAEIQRAIELMPEEERDAVLHRAKQKRDGS